MFACSWSVFGSYSLFLLYMATICLVHYIGVNKRWCSHSAVFSFGEGHLQSNANIFKLLAPFISICGLIFAWIQILAKTDNNTVMEAVDAEVSITCIDLAHVKKTFQLALLCTKKNPSERPTMHEVARVLVSLLPSPPSKILAPPAKKFDYANFVIEKGQPRKVEGQPHQEDNNSTNAQWFVRFGDVISKSTWSRLLVSTYVPAEGFMRFTLDETSFFLWFRYNRLQHLTNRWWSISIGDKTLDYIISICKFLLLYTSTCFRILLSVKWMANHATSIYYAFTLISQTSYGYIINSSSVHEIILYLKRTSYFFFGHLRQQNYGYICLTCCLRHNSSELNGEVSSLSCKVCVDGVALSFQVL